MLCCSPSVNRASEEVMPTAAELSAAEAAPPLAAEEPLPMEPAWEEPEWEEDEEEAPGEEAAGEEAELEEPEPGQEAPGEEEAAGEEEAPGQEESPVREAPVREEAPAPAKKAPESAAPGSTFEVALDAAEGGHGIVADWRGSTLLVVSVDSAEIAKLVKPNDFIVEIHGQTDPEEMFARLAQQSASIKMVVHRPAPFKATVRKEGRILGLRLAYVTTSTTVAITEIMEGAAEEYNKIAAPEVQLRLEDRILSVNGVDGHADRMVEALRRDDTVDLIIARASP